MKHRPRMALKKGKWTATKAKFIIIIQKKRSSTCTNYKNMKYNFSYIKLWNLLQQCVNLHSLQFFSSLKSIKELSEIIFLFIKNCKLCSYLKWAWILLCFVCFCRLFWQRCSKEVLVVLAEFLFPKLK